MSRRIGQLLGLGGVLVVASVLAHQLVFLARYGSQYGEALVHAGHGETWSAAVEASAAIGFGLVVLAAVRLGWLALQLRRLRARGVAVGNLGLADLARTWLRFGTAVASTSVIVLTVQENLEHAAAGLPVVGAGILVSPEYPFGLLITIAVGFLVGLVAALFDWRRRVLLARLRAARRERPRPAIAAPVRRVALELAAAGSILGRRLALRAPPRRVLPG